MFSEIEYIGDTVWYIVCEYDASTLGVPIEDGDSVIRVDTDKLTDELADTLASCVTDDIGLDDWLRDGDDVELITVLWDAIVDTLYVGV